MYILTCTHPQTRTGTSSGNYPNNYRRSRIERSIRLEPANKTLPGDDSSSTHHLAAENEAEDRRSVCDLESRAIDRLRPAGNKFTSNITGRGASGNGSRSSFDGILVKNETIVRVGSK